MKYYYFFYFDSIKTILCLILLSKASILGVFFFLNYSILSSYDNSFLFDLDFFVYFSLSY